MTLLYGVFTAYISTRQLVGQSRVLMAFLFQYRQMARDPRKNPTIVSADSSWHLKAVVTQLYVFTSFPCACPCNLSKECPAQASHSRPVRSRNKSWRFQDNQKPETTS